ncbi:hypothetical protein ACFPES_00820 [Paenibacillus sp. GCM10023248]|uniref:hypothetical protein n=1 Tax=Bacillales TaxID=1385 RepID=UPI002377DFC3|nr:MULTISPECIES: hypothetical protein [Bacillales]MDD9265564.1 hypothetical protein [Paenibacillus sp. MAHUQ-63]MDR6878801.1 hypothetical protein [Bacillus sp. 3255]
MIGITIVFVAIAGYELQFLIRHRRKPRTFWIAGSFLAAAYLYIMAIHAYDLPSVNRIIEYVFNF